LAVNWGLSSASVLRIQMMVIALLPEIHESETPDWGECDAGI